jgi:hypothetical protein
MIKIRVALKVLPGLNLMAVHWGPARFLAGSDQSPVTLDFTGIIDGFSLTIQGYGLVEGNLCAILLGYNQFLNVVCAGLVDHLEITSHVLLHRLR